MVELLLYGPRPYLIALLTFAAILFTPIKGSAQQSKPHAIPTTICSILSNPHLYLHHQISFDATLELVLPSGTWLVDEKCPKHSIALGWPKTKADGNALDKVLYCGSVGTSDKKITGHFAGMLRIGQVGEFGRRGLFLDRFTTSDLQLTFKPGKEVPCGPPPVHPLDIPTPPPNVFQ